MPNPIPVIKQISKTRITCARKIVLDFPIQLNFTYMHFYVPPLTSESNSKREIERQTRDKGTDLCCWESTIPLPAFVIP